ncbi:UNVERIFIED_CONTAM: B3 domain-containing protein [Sesamum angustifolium]|uniref:B3 domain-containing protein n=1 Tax=Sesamum angustifolium TaxID=2727405 RepID=A0AAW2NKC2_9LAMI
MKLKIVHQNQESRGGEEQVMKKEELELEQMEEPQIHVSPENESTKENSPPPELSPISGSHPMLISGKRRRKPKELIDEVSPIIRRKKRKSSASKSKIGTPDSGGTLMSKGNGTISGSTSPVQLKSPTMIRAEEGLPVPFCKVHLPIKDTTVILENENGEEFPIKYIAHKTGLSAGWRKFVAGNKLLEGDVLIFQLIGPCMFKVMQANLFYWDFIQYIIRANDLTEVDGALSLLILDSQIKQNDAEGTVDAQSKKRRPKSLPLTVVQKKKEKEEPLVPQLGQPEEQSGNDSDEVASEVLEGTKFSGSSFHFKDVKSFEEFHIVVNGVCIDSELPEHIRQKYYDLCCSKNAFLHDRVLPGLYSKLAAGMIVETINIADVIRGCKLNTPRKDFEVWEKSLRSFELLGLNVGFLRARLRRLLSLAFDTEGALEVRRYWETQKERSRTEEEIQKLEAQLVELKELSAKYDHERENLKTKAESYELKFQEEVDAPW